MGNILTAMGAPAAQQAINTTMTEMEERPYREEARTNRMAMDKMTLEKAQIEMKNIKEREAFLEQKVNFGQTLREKGEFHENTIQYGEKGFKNLGIIDESGMISRKNLGRAAMEMENQEKVMKNVFKYDLEQRTADMDKAWKKFEKTNEEDSGATQQEKIDAKKTYEEAKRLESVAAGRIGQIDKHYETKKEMREILQELKSDPEFKKLVSSDPTLQGKIQTAIKLNDPTLLRQVVAKAFEQSGKPETVTKPISMGNASELAMNEKFPGWMKDPIISEKAHRWLGTNEGKQKVQEWTQRTTPQTVNYIDTGSGIVPGVTRGPGVGSVGSPTGLGKRLNSQDLEELSNMKTTYERLTDVEKNAVRLKDKFGPIEGRWNKLKIKFVGEGATQGVVNELESMITVAYSLSGKQISYKEMELLKAAMLPRLEQPYENLTATINFAKDWMAKTHDNRLDYVKQSGYQTEIKRIREKETITLSEKDARSQLEEKGITGKEQDEWILKYKQAGKIK